MSATDPLFDEEDLYNPDFRCKHGTFIGNPYGADYMCFYCEMGFSDAEYQAHLNYKLRRAIYRRFCSEVFELVFKQMPHTANFEFAWSPVIQHMARYR